MQLAIDPRIPEDQQAFLFKLANLPQDSLVDWYVNQALVASTPTGEYLWPLQPGTHWARACIRSTNSDQFKETAEVHFIVSDHQQNWLFEEGSSKRPGPCSADNR
jgi:penicillin-binding protein 1C